MVIHAWIQGIWGRGSGPTLKAKCHKTVIMVFGIWIFLKKKKKKKKKEKKKKTLSKLDPLLTKLSGSAHAISHVYIENGVKHIALC